MVTNSLLRFFWVIMVMTKEWRDTVDYLGLLFFGSIMAEAIRRTQWSLIRVENEFFNNFEAYRTIQTIPNVIDDVDKTLKVDRSPN